MDAMIITATFLFAGMVKGVTGMGLPTVGMGILGAVMGPPVAAAMLLLPSLVTNLWQLFAGPSVRVTLRRFWLMMIAIFTGTVVASPFLTSGSWAGPALGAALIVYALHGLFAPRLVVPLNLEWWLSPLVGGVTGLISGMTGVFVIPAVPYLQALGLEKEDLIQALGLSFTVSTLALTVGLGRSGILDGAGVLASGLAVFPALLGMWAGQHLRQRISPAMFRWCFLGFLLFLGSELTLRPFF